MATVWSITQLMALPFPSLMLFRPRSMLGGDLHWIWKPYGLYMNIDYVSHENHLYL